ncbi:MAG: hypothetical protein FWD61_02110 [Phycisphaerales bacterium]|nr:hypothetical protein [Phycisphaerales bacterium]
MSYDTELADIQSSLQQRISEGITSRMQLHDLHKRIALLTLDALQNPWHPLKKRLAELRKVTCVLAKPDDRDEPHKKLYAANTAIPYNQDRCFFTPHPGSSGRTQRYFWPLQLLLLVVTMTPHCAKLPELLKRPESSLCEAANLGFNASVDLYETQYPSYLLEALTSLKMPLDENGFDVDNRTFRWHGRSVHLSPQESQFLRLLWNRRGKAVFHSDFRNVAIRYPAKVKQRLSEKFQQASIDLTMKASTKYYKLA